MSADKEDKWDDSLLIKAYDDSVSLTRETLAHRIADSTNRREESEEEEKHDMELLEETPPSFKVGDFARATYTDGLDYEGTIVSIDEKEASCVLRYVGYENEQEILLSDLLPSWGSKARREQVEQSANQPDVEDAPQAQRSKTFKKSTVAKGKQASSSGSRLSGLAMPPMPLVPPMFSPSGGMDAEPDQDFVAMLTAWYMSGYYTGLYQGKKESSAKKKTAKK
ncbi:survival motor neuron protein [Drosophila innubila]|uniref:survival motor neuron protein n=1 Tax=Drosophila innubila TaxID=198719 RepID=UPI00148E5DCB|nr:survival motor neuron protein [Drosophila innubila]